MASLGLLAILHLVGGAIISVLPLQALPFEPEQSFDNYFSHVIYGLTQMPLIWNSIKWFFVSDDRETSTPGSLEESD